MDQKANAGAALLFTRIGQEFIPTLNENPAIGWPGAGSSRTSRRRGSGSRSWCPSVLRS
jgi:hypothetical protein